MRALVIECPLNAHEISEIRLNGERIPLHRVCGIGFNVELNGVPKLTINRYPVDLPTGWELP